MLGSRKVPLITENRRHRYQAMYQVPKGGLIFLLLQTILTLTQSGCNAQTQNSESGWISSIVEGVSELSCSALGNCCEDTLTFRQAAIPTLHRTLQEKFFGQHIAMKTVIHALDAHLYQASPEKSLVLSFHGSTGSGKSYLARTIIGSLFAKGMDSKNVKLIHTPSILRSDASKVKEYKKHLQEEIMEILKNCPHSLIVFDQLANTPIEQEVLQAILPFIGYPAHKNAIFIFISNTGSDPITEITSQVFSSGRIREDLTYLDFEHQLMSNALSNQEEMGLYKRSLIDQIDFFVPFLPMEKVHVRQCIALEASRHPGIRIDHEKIIKAIEFTPWFSTTGCKRIEAAVKYEHEDDLYKKSGNSDAIDQNRSGGGGTRNPESEYARQPQDTPEQTANDATREEGGTWLKAAATLGVGAAVGVAAVAATPVVLTAAGFSGAGVVAGSLAASVHSIVSGGSAMVAFSACQSAGAAGLAATSQAFIATLAGVFGATTFSAITNIFNSTSSN